MRKNRWECEKGKGKCKWADARGLEMRGNRCFGRPLGEGDSKMGPGLRARWDTGACDRCRCYSRWRYKALPLGKAGP